MEITEVLTIVGELCKQIDLLCACTNFDAEDCSATNIAYTKENPQTAFQYGVLSTVLKNLNNASERYHSYLSTETETFNEGRLHYDTDTERFYLNSTDLHCGDCLEVCVTDMYNGISLWIPTRIEATADDKWYLVGVGKRYNISTAKDIVGLPARMRRNHQ